VRIIAGAFRGRRLTPLGPGDRAAHLRPTADRVRESLFSMLGHRARIEDARVIDLFAGTGALGLEALSRGAACACFVEDGRVALGLLDRNIALLAVGDRTAVLRQDARRLAEPPPMAPFDLAFLDPPYGKGLGEAALAALRDRGWLAGGGLVAWEEAAPMLAPAGYSGLDQRRYGDSWITLLQRDAG
jgi:16S rRNA (guanine966-N2)-methyltransferase